LTALLKPEDAQVFLTGITQKISTSSSNSSSSPPSSSSSSSPSDPTSQIGGTQLETIQSIPVGNIEENSGSSVVPPPTLTSPQEVPLPDNEDDNNDGEEEEEETKEPPKVFKRNTLTFLKPQVSQEHKSLQSFTEFQTSLAGGTLTDKLAKQNTVMVAKFLKFQRIDESDQVIVNDIDCKLNGGLCDATKIQSFIEALMNNGAAPLTAKKYAVAFKSAIHWRQNVILLQPQISERQDVLSAYSHVLSVLDKIMKSCAKKNKDRKVPSISELKQDGRWCSIEEFQTAVKSYAEPEFLKIIERIKQNPSHELSQKEKSDGIAYVIAFFYGFNRPARPGFLSEITIKEWKVIQEKGTHTTQKFKTHATYGALTVSFSPDTIRLWKLYQDFLRPNLLGDQKSRFFLLNSSGKQLSAVSAKLERFSEMALKKCLCPTILRAMAATEANDNLGKDCAELIHRGDVHSNAVVKSTYDKRNSERIDRRKQVVLANVPQSQTQPVNVINQLHFLTSRLKSVPFWKATISTIHIFVIVFFIVFFFFLF